MYIELWEVSPCKCQIEIDYNTNKVLNIYTHTLMSCSVHYSMARYYPSHNDKLVSAYNVPGNSQVMPNALKPLVTAIHFNDECKVDNRVLIPREQSKPKCDHDWRDSRNEAFKKWCSRCGEYK